MNFLQNASNNAVLRALVEAGANVNKQEKYGATPLMFAALRNNQDAAEEFIRCKDIIIDV